MDEYLNKLDEYLNESENSSIDYIEQYKCCDNINMVNFTCINCGYVDETNTILDVDNEDGMDYNLPITSTVISGNSKNFYRVKKCQLFYANNYTEYMFDNQLKPLVEGILTFNNNNCIKIKKKVMNMYKEYYDVKKSKRGKVKTLIILFFIYILSVRYPTIKFDIKKNLTNYKITKLNIKRLKNIKDEFESGYFNYHNDFVKLCSETMKTKIN